MKRVFLLGELGPWWELKSYKYDGELLKPDYIDICLAY